MKDIGMFRAYLSAIHSARNRAVAAVDERNTKALVEECKKMQMLLIDAKTLAYQQEDV